MYRIFQVYYTVKNQWICKACAVNIAQEDETPAFDKSIILIHDRWF